VAAGGIEGLLSLLSPIPSRDPACIEHALASLLTISLTDGADTLITQNNGLEAIVHVLQTGSASARETAAAAIFTLSHYPGRQGPRAARRGHTPLKDLLQSGSLRGKDSCLALFNLTLDEKCAQEIVDYGTPGVLLGLLATETDPGLEDKAVAVIANLAKYPEGRQAVVEYEGAIGTLLQIMDGGSSRSKRMRWCRCSCWRPMCRRARKRSLRKGPRRRSASWRRRVRPGPSLRSVPGTVIPVSVVAVAVRSLYVTVPGTIFMSLSMFV